MLKQLMKSKNDDLTFPWFALFIQALLSGWFIFRAIYPDKLDTMEEFNSCYDYLLGACIGLAILGQIMAWADKLSKRVAALEEKLNQLKRPGE